MRDSSFSSALLVWILLASAPSAALAQGHGGGHSGSHSAGPFGGFGDFGGGFGSFGPAPTLAPVITSPAALATSSRPDGRWEFDPNAWRRASPGWSDRTLSRPDGRWEFDPNAWRRASPGWSGSSP